MYARLGWLMLGVLGVTGCHSIGFIEPPPDPVFANQLWEKGQSALRDGHNDEAIDFYQQSLIADPGLMKNHLSLAVLYLQDKDDEKAGPHLGAFLLTEPKNLAVRLYYADLLVRLHKSREARKQFERFESDSQEEGKVAVPHRIHAHSQLMEIAEAEDNEYAEHLHRGIGLYLLAQERTETPDPDDELPLEGLLCKAAGELTQACEARPQEAQPAWYLSLVWSRLDQRKPALRWLREADACAAFSTMTASERRNLQVACLESLLQRDSR